MSEDLDIDTTEAEDPPKKEKGKKDPAALVRHWLTELDLAEKAHKDFWKEGDDAIDKYLSHKSSKDCDKTANIYFGSIESIKPSIYSSQPKPDIRRRFKDNNRLARISAEQLERAVSYSLDCHQDINLVYEQCRDDFLLPGRCITWERFKPTFETVDTPVPVTMQEAEAGFSEALGRELSPDEIQQDPAGALFVLEKEEKIVYAEASTDYVNWKDYLHNPARTKDEIRWRARRHYLTRDDLEREYGKEKGVDVDDIERTAKPPNWDDKTGSAEDQKRYTRAEVWEIWDKVSRKVFHITKGYKKQPLKTQDDPLGLKGFFPCPTECVAISSTNNVIPRTEYRAARAQSETIDKLTTRIDVLVDSIRTSGVYDKAAGPEVEAVLSEDNKLVPIKNWPAFQQAGGWQGVMQFMPLDGIIAALQQLYDARERELQLYYEITGYSDIMRGVTDPRETATAQEGKMQFASSRVREKQRRFHRFIRDAIAIKAEVIAEHFPPEVIVAISGMEAYSEQAAPEELLQSAAMLKDDVRRTYMLEIETDSTVASDDQLDKQRVSEFLGAVTPYMQQVMQAQGPTLTIMGELLQFAIRHFKAGRSTENAVEQWVGQLQQAQQAAQGQPPPPDPEMQKAQAQMQLEEMRTQNRMQLEQFKAQQQSMIAQNKLQHDQYLKEMDMRFQMVLEYLKAQNQMKVEQVQAQADVATKQAEMVMKREVAIADSVTKAMVEPPRLGM